MDIIGIGYFIVLGGFLSGLGIGLDKLVLNKQKSLLEDKLIIFWDKVDNLEFKDIARLLAKKYLVAENRIFGKTMSLRWLITTLIVSLLLTCLMIILGKTLGIFLLDTCTSIYHGTTSNIDGMSYLKIGWSYFLNNAEKFKAITLNYAFDFLTIAATVYLLERFILSERSHTRYFWIIIDIFICIFLLQFCIFIGLQIDGTNVLHEQIKTPFEIFGTLYKDLNISTSRFSCGSFHLYSGALAYSATILIPTIIYLSIIIVLMLAKTAHDLGKFILLQVSELGLEGEKTVFYYTGIFLSTVIIGLKILKELLSIL